MRVYISICLFILTSYTYANECYRCYQQRAALAMHCMVNPSLYGLYPKWCNSLVNQARYFQHYHIRLDNFIKQSGNKRKVNRIVKKWVTKDPCDRCYSQIYTSALLNCFTQQTQSNSGTQYCKLAKTYIDVVYRYFIRVNPTIPVRR